MDGSESVAGDHFRVPSSSSHVRGVHEGLPICNEGEVPLHQQENYTMDTREQRSHIAIIQMAPPAPGSTKSVTSGSVGLPRLPTAQSSAEASVLKSTRTKAAGESSTLRISKAGGRQRPENGASKKKRHYCSVQGCAYNTPHSKDLTRHMRKHTGEKPYTCDRCTNSFTRYDKLVMHIRIHEGHRPFSCQFCTYAASDSSSLRKHLRTHSNERPYKCQLCPYSSKDSSQLKVHLRSHTGDSPYLCNFTGCDAAFKTPSDLSRHIRCHTREKPYKCLYCDYRAAVKCNLNVHMKRHTNPAQKKRNPNSSNKQGIPVEDTDEETEEIEPSHILTQEAPALSRSNPALLPFQYACKLCSYKADTIELFSIHMDEVHPDSSFGLNNQDKTNKTAKRRTKRITDFSETRTFQCSSCNAAFVCEDSLRCHMRQHGAVPNKPANVDPQIYSPTNRIRLLHNNHSSTYHSSSHHASGNYSNETPAGAVTTTTNSENAYVIHEMQKMPVVHSVITENPSVHPNCNNSVVQQQHYDPDTGHTYLVTYNNNGDGEPSVEHVNIMYQVHE